MPDENYCEKYHVPPQFLETLHDPDAPVFTNKGTFCVVRHPYERALSEYKYMISVAWGKGMSDMHNTGLLEKPKCSPDGLNNFVQKALRNYIAGKKFLHDCHFVPQTDYIYGQDGRQWCRNVLRNENLAASFNKLMKKYRYPARLSMERINNSSEACPNLSIDSFYKATLHLLDFVYREDFKRLGYNSTQKSVSFLDIPSTGGLLMEEPLKGVGVLVPRSLPNFATREQLPDSSWCDKQHVPVQYLDAEDAETYQDTEVFCMTQHPYDRAISAYSRIATDPDGDRMLAAYGAKPMANSSACTAEGLNAFLAEALPMLRGGRRFAFDCLLAPQHEYIWNGDRQICTKISRAANGGRDLSNFLRNRTYFVEPKVFQENDAPQSRPCSKLGRDSLNQHSLQLLHLTYEKDFDKLSFSRK